MYTDHEIGRVIDAVGETGQLDNTLVIYILGDNGTSAEGGMNGMYNEYTYFNGVAESVADILKHYDELGGPMSYAHMAAGWAVAGDTPFSWTKQVGSDFGGSRGGVRRAIHASPFHSSAIDAVHRRARNDSTRIWHSRFMLPNSPVCHAVHDSLHAGGRHWSVPSHRVRRHDGKHVRHVTTAAVMGHA